MQVRTTRKYHFMPIRMVISKKTYKLNAGEDLEKREPSRTAGGNVN